MTKNELRKQPFTIRQISVEGVVSEKTIRRWLDGVSIRQTSLLRIQRAMENLGLTDGRVVRHG